MQRAVDVGKRTEARARPEDRRRESIIYGRCSTTLRVHGDRGARVEPPDKRDRDVAREFSRIRGGNADAAERFL